MTTINIVFAVCAISIVIALSYLILKKNNIESHSIKSTAVLNFVSAVSIILAGAWTFSTFDLLHQRDIAEEQYEELLRKSRNIESSKIALKTEIVNYDFRKNGSKGLIINILLTNVGNSTIHFDLSKNPVTVYEVIAEGDKIGYTKTYKPNLYAQLAEIGTVEENTPLDKFILLTSSERELSYFVSLPSDKLYYVVFSTENSNAEDCGKEKCSWIVSNYIYVGSDNHNIRSNIDNLAQIPIFN